VLSLLAGALVMLALPPVGWWPSAFGGVALFDRLLDGRSAGSRFRRGSLVGVGLFLPSLLWMAAFTPPGYVVAVVAFSATLGVAALACPPTAPGRWVALPGALVSFEAVKGRFPFGGVPLSTFAMGQVGEPLVGTVRVGGVLLLGGLTAALGVALSAALARRRLPVAVALGVVVAAAGLAVVAPRGTDTADPPLRVAIVQGGGQQGTRAKNTDERAVFERHLAASGLITQPVDLVLWPEDVVQVYNDITTAPEGAELAALARRLHTTLSVGVVETLPGGRFRNSQIAYDPDGNLVDRYVKVRRVPFGEYTPFRAELEHIAGKTLIPAEAVKGADPATLDTPVGTVGTVISWEVFFPDRAREAIRRGGEILTNPTNGSSYRGPQVQSQQLASSRLRAIETGRWVLQAAPTGYSAVITPGGRVVTRTAITEQAVLTGTIMRRHGLTWPDRFGDGPALALALLAVGGGQLLARRSRAHPAVPEASGGASGRGNVMAG
jgi:apolipoprotein N-acyltransferase